MDKRTRMRVWKREREFRGQDKELLFMLVMLIGKWNLPKKNRCLSWMAVKKIMFPLYRTEIIENLGQYKWETKKQENCSLFKDYHLELRICSWLYVGFCLSSKLLYIEFVHTLNVFFLVAKLLYKSKCPSVCMYVCLSVRFRGKRDFLASNWDIAPIFLCRFPS